MKKFFLITFLVPLFAYGQAQYNVAGIPPTLLENANAVIRKSVDRINIEGKEKMSHFRQHAITILNPAGLDYADFEIQYSNNKVIKNISGALYDAAGKKIKNLKKGDLEDISATSDNNLADDQRIRNHSFEYQAFPYTVEYEYETEQSNYFYFPAWYVIPGEKIAVQESSLTIQMPADYNLRYRNFNLNDPFTEFVKNKKTLSWKTSGYNAMQDETYSAAWHERTPVVFLAPTEFSVKDYQGSINDWASFGKFMFTLNKGRDILPVNIKSKVHELTDGLQSDVEKIEKLYKYMQQNTRYISVQLGIGGWQTFDAAHVAKNGYGDCKGLSNYMMSLLKESGVKSYYTLIQAGREQNSFIADFPSNQFNHAILCIPLTKDTIWLECTSQTTPTGYLGSFTGNRNALVITEQGGVLVKTPKYNAEQNLQYRVIKSVLDAGGNLSSDIMTEYYSEQQEEVAGYLHEASKEIISNYLKDKLTIPTYDVITYSYEETKTAKPLIRESLEVYAPNYASVTGKRMFILPNILNRSGNKITDASKRKSPYIINFEYLDVDSIIIEIPAGYDLESKPQNVNLETRFGNYSSTYSYSPGKLVYLRKMRRLSGKFPASDGGALSEFYETIHKSDKARLVLVKKD